MENASKALYIVIGVILGLLLLSVMIYVFRQGARINETYDQKQISLQLELYNSQFENFDRPNNNILDVISLCNLAFDINKGVEYDESSTILVEILIGTREFIFPNKAQNAINERNVILNENSPMPIYNLVESTLKDLSISSIPQKTGIYSLAELPRDQWVTIDMDLENDKLSTTKLKSGKTIYKYLFGLSPYRPMEYHKHNGKVSKITLIAYYNPEWED